MKEVRDLQILRNSMLRTTYNLSKHIFITFVQKEYTIDENIYTMYNNNAAAIAAAYLSCCLCTCAVNPSFAYQKSSAICLYILTKLLICWISHRIFLLLFKNRSTWQTSRAPSLKVMKKEVNRTDIKQRHMTFETKELYHTLICIHAYKPTPLDSPIETISWKTVESYSPALVCMCIFFFIHSDQL